MDKHCCFNTSDVLFRSARIHVPLAKKCSMGCQYCGYHIDHNICMPTIKRPGTSLIVVSTENEIRTYLKKAFALFPETSIIGVSGPGDPLDNLMEMTLLKNIMEKDYPTVKLCLCTNGRNYQNYVTLFEHSPLLKYLTLTINTLIPQKNLKIYHSITTLSKAEEMIKNQLKILQKAKEQDIKIKINTVFLQEINATEIEEMYLTLLEKYQVDCFNVLPFVPINTKTMFSVMDLNIFNETIFSLNEKGFPITKQCQQCRSDFCGY